MNLLDRKKEEEEEEEEKERIGAQYLVEQLMFGNKANAF
jgi:hypothetical protein